MSSGKKVAQAAGILMIAMMASRILGFIREAVLARSFGTTGTTDAFLAAFTIPDLMYDLLVGGVLSSAFMPVFSSYLATDKEEDAWEVANTMINLITIIMLVSIILGMVFAHPLTKLVAYKFSGETLDLSVKLMRLMFPAFVILALNGLIMGILNSYKHFTAPALGTVSYNLSIIVVGLLLKERLGIAGFAVGVVVGHVTNFLIQMPALKKRGLRYRFVLNLKHPGVRKMMVLMVPSMLGLAASRVIYIVNQNFASAINEGSITALRLAYRLMWLPLGVFAGAIANAIFPTMNSHAAKKEMSEFKKTMSIGIRSIFLIIIPASVGLAVLSEPIVRLLFENGKFTAESTQITAYALVFYCIGLFAHAAVWVVTRGFYSFQDTVRPVIVATTTIVLNIPLSRLFISLGLGEKGLALAFSLTGIYNFVILLYLLRKKIGRLDIKRMIKSFVAITICSGFMGIVAYAVSNYLGNQLNLATTTGRLTQVGVSILVGLAVFAGTIIFFRLEETEVIMGILRRKLRRTG